MVLSAALLQGGKLNVILRLNAATNRLLVHVKCHQTAMRYVVDIGATLSIVPQTSNQPSAHLPKLVSLNSQLVFCLVQEQLQLLLGGPSFKWTSTQSEVKFSIPGVDFLQAKCLSLIVGSPATTLPQSCFCQMGPGETPSPPLYWLLPR